MVYKPNKNRSKLMTMEIRIDRKTGQRTDSLGRPIGKIKPIPPAKNEPTKDDLIARKPTTKEEYDKWMRRNKEGENAAKILRQKAIENERKNRKSWIQRLREGEAS